MPSRVELHVDASAELARFSLADQDDFWRRLAWVSERPLRRSEALQEPALSAYTLRAFEFGVGVAKTAVFEYRPVDNRIRVIRCRIARPRRVRRDAD